MSDKKIALGRFVIPGFPKNVFSDDFVINDLQGNPVFEINTYGDITVSNSKGAQRFLGKILDVAKTDLQE